MGTEKKRVAVYVDGLSLYYSIVELIQKDPRGALHEDHSLKWLDVRKLAESFCRDQDKLVRVYYCSAYGVVKKRGYMSLKERTAINKRHRNYIKALTYHGVTCNLSYFTYGRKTFPLAKNLSWTQPKEKETDVKLTMQMLEDAVEDIFDVGILISRDGDFVPLIKRIREKYNKDSKVGIVKSNKIQSQRLYKVYGESNIIFIKKETLLQCQLPDEIPLRDGNLLHRPDKYCPR